MTFQDSGVSSSSVIQCAACDPLGALVKAAGLLGRTVGQSGVSGIAGEALCRIRRMARRDLVLICRYPSCYLSLPACAVPLSPSACGSLCLSACLCPSFCHVSLDSPCRPNGPSTIAAGRCQRTRVRPTYSCRRNSFLTWT